MFRVYNTLFAAVVDTATEVTIISEDLFNAMKVKPRKVKDVCCSNKSIHGSVVRQVNLNIGNNMYT